MITLNDFPAVPDNHPDKAIKRSYFRIPLISNWNQSGEIITIWCLRNKFDNDLTKMRYVIKHGRKR